MKLSKRQLKRIIREEYTQLLSRGLIRESKFAADRKLNLDIIEELRDAEDGVPVNALYNVIFSDVDPRKLADEIDHLVQIGYADLVGDVLYLGYIPPHSQFAQKPRRI